MIYTSPFGSLPIPQDKTLWDFLELHARSEATAHAPAFICSVTARQVSFSQMLTQAQQICAGLHARGINKGDVRYSHRAALDELHRIPRGALRSDSPPSDLLDRVADVQRAGAERASNNCQGTVLSCPRRAPRELTSKMQMEYQTNSAACSLTLVCDAGKSHYLPQSACSGRGRRRQTRRNRSYSGVHDGACVREHGPGINGRFNSEEPAVPGLAAHRPASSDAAPILQRHDRATQGCGQNLGEASKPVDTLLLRLSQGVKMTARALLASTISFSYIDQPGQYTLALLPFYHIMATTISNSCIYTGKTVVVMPKFVPDQFLSLVEHYRLEKLHMAPPVVLFLAQHPMVDNYDLSSLKEIGCGGAPLGVEIEARAEKRFNATVLQGFGMSELCGGAVYSTPFAKRAGSTGKLMPNASLKVKCLRTGKNLPPNQLGELMFHTPHIMEGYLNNPQASKDAIDEDGFVRSGDVGYIDDDGFVFIIDRIKELIKYKGHQVAPAQLEDVLNNHPSIADSCCVRGFNFTTSEEIPKAYVVLKHAPEVDTSQRILEFVASRVAPFKIVREVEFIDVIPRTLSGKILRRELQVRENAKINAIRRQHVMDVQL